MHLMRIVMFAFFFLTVIIILKKVIYTISKNLMFGNILWYFKVFSPSKMYT